MKSWLSLVNARGFIHFVIKTDISIDEEGPYNKLAKLGDAIAISNLKL